MSANGLPLAVLGVDPGSAKCGVAVVSGPQLTVLHRSIVPTAKLTVAAGDLISRLGNIGVIVIGNGTGSKVLAKALRAAYPSVPVESVDEVSTTLMARERYCRENPARGWMKLLPAGMRVPDEPIDDYVAVILAERRLAASKRQ